MQYSRTVIRKLPSGGFKLYIWGQPDNHIMDWLGCNYRLLTLPGQPRKGFHASEDALGFLARDYPSEVDVRKWAEHAGDGSFLTDALSSTIIIQNAWAVIADTIPTQDRPNYIAPGIQRRAPKHQGH